MAGVDIISSQKAKLNSAHPLLLEVVINSVFETLEAEDLLKCRLVCKNWMHNSCLKANLKKKSIINLRCIFLHTATTRDNLLDYFQLSGPIYEHFHFVNISYHNTLIHRFFHVIGPTIRILKLQLNLYQLNVSHFRELIYERVPNLTDLNVYSLSHEEVFLKKLFLPTEQRMKHANLKRLEMQEIRTPISRFMTQFMGTLENIREIILKVDVCSDWSDQADLWRENSPLATSIITGLKRSDAFKTLNVIRCGKLCLKHFEALYEMGTGGLQLETFEAHMPCKDAEEICNAFINTQKNALKYLIIFEQRSARYSHRSKHNEQDQVFVLRLPEIMPRLELLQLSKYTKSFVVRVHPVDYTRQCPRLRKLILLGCSDEENSCGSFYIPKEKCFSLDELILWNRPHDTNIAYFLGHSFSLTQLTLRYPSQDFLKALWTSCDGIQSLCLFIEEGCCMDEAITGIPSNIITRWVDSSRPGKSSDVAFDCKDIDGDEYQIDKSIRNLKDLRSLKIVVDYDDTCERQALCDASAYFALKEMKHLRYLELFSSHWHAGLTRCQFFSERCCNHLRTHLNLAVIHFSPHENT